MKKGTSVVIIGTDTVLGRTPHLVGQVGTVYSVPVHPTTWYKVQFSDGNVVTFRPSALRAVPAGCTDPEVIAKIVATAGPSNSAHTSPALQPAKDPESQKQHTSSLSDNIPEQRYGTRKRDYNSSGSSNASGSYDKVYHTSNSSSHLLHANKISVPLDSDSFKSFMRKKRSYMTENFDTISAILSLRSDPISPGSFFDTPLFTKECMRDYIDRVCLHCHEERWLGAKHCWNENCTSSPIFWQLSGARGRQIVREKKFYVNEPTNLSSEEVPDQMETTSVCDEVLSIQEDGIEHGENQVIETCKPRSDSSLTDQETLSPLLSTDILNTKYHTNNGGALSASGYIFIDDNFKLPPSIDQVSQY